MSVSLWPVIAELAAGALVRLLQDCAVKTFRDVDVIR
jgi:hypothetical protein